MHGRERNGRGHDVNHFSEKVSFIWSVADLLRGDYKQSDYGKVILPFTILRRLDQVLAATRQAVWDADAKYPKGATLDTIRDNRLLKAAGQSFYNTSKLSLDTVTAADCARDLTVYVQGFSADARDVMEKFRFDEQIRRLDEANLLFRVVQKFRGIDLHPYRRQPDGALLLDSATGDPVPNVTNLEMGYIFEELIRKFSEQSNETAGEHFTPREVIRLMVNLLLAPEKDLTRSSVVKTLYDPACGTGGMLSVAEEWLRGFNTEATFHVYGQELNDESFAICKADMLIKGQDANRIKKGNSFTEDGHPHARFDYMMSNPPFGVDWSKAEKAVTDEHEQKGHGGRFGPGLPRRNDGSLLFLLHMMSKMKPVEPGPDGATGGSRIAIVFNGSPLFTGSADSGESRIRRHIVENDLLEAIVALPDQLFYNTGINTYLWIVTNRKPKHRKGKVQLVNGVTYFQKMRKSLGDKRKELSDDHISALTKVYEAFTDGPHSKVFRNEDFGYYRITVERPLRLSFQVTPDRLLKLVDHKGWRGLVEGPRGKPLSQAERDGGEAIQKTISGVLKALPPGPDCGVWKSRETFVGVLEAEFKKLRLKVPATAVTAVVESLAVRDESADPCKDKKGHIEPDPDLRDNENVPLTDDIDAYMKREVLPHVPDAWVDVEKTKIGYEIPFTRHFYEYVPPRDLGVIEREIRDLEAAIQVKLREVLG